MNDETARLRIQSPKKGGGEDLYPPGPRVVQRKHTWCAPGLQILKLDRTDSGGNPDDHEDAYYSPES